MCLAVATRRCSPARRSRCGRSPRPRAPSHSRRTGACPAGEVVLRLGRHGDDGVQVEGVVPALVFSRVGVVLAVAEGEQLHERVGEGLRQTDLGLVLVARRGGPRTGMARGSSSTPTASGVSWACSRPFLPPFGRTRGGFTCNRRRNGSNGPTSRSTFTSCSRSPRRMVRMNCMYSAPGTATYPRRSSASAITSNRFLSATTSARRSRSRSIRGPLLGHRAASISVLPPVCCKCLLLL